MRLLLKALVPAVLLASSGSVQGPDQMGQSYSVSDNITFHLESFTSAERILFKTIMVFLGYGLNSETGEMYFITENITF